MHNFSTQAFLSFKALFPWLHWWSYLSSVWIRPFMTAAMFAVIGRFAVGSEAAERYILGLAVIQMIALQLVGVLRTFSDDLAQGTLSHVLSSSVNRFRLYWARGLPHTMNGWLAFASCLFSVWLVLGMDFSHANWPAMFGAAILVGLSTTSLALLGSSVVLMTREHSNLNQVMTGLLMTLTGLIIPLRELPQVLRLFGNALPVTHGFAGLREAFNGGTLADIAPDLAAEAGIALLLTAAGFFIFRYVEAKGRQRGILEGGM